MTSFWNTPIETFEVGHLTIDIFPDENAESPREWDNLGTILYLSSSRYILGDEGVSLEEIEEITEREDVLCLPVYAYIHSGVTINTRGFHCPWDSGQSGIIYVTHERIIKEYGELTEETKEKALKVLRAEIENYDQYLRGDVYGYIISEKKTCDLDHEHKEHVDSCWGFFGAEYAMQEARSVAEYIVKNNPPAASNG